MIVFVLLLVQVVDDRVVPGVVRDELENFKDVLEDEQQVVVEILGCPVPGEDLVDASHGGPAQGDATGIVQLRVLEYGGEKWRELVATATTLRQRDPRQQMQEDLQRSMTNFQRVHVKVTARRVQRMTAAHAHASIGGGTGTVETLWREQGIARVVLREKRRRCKVAIMIIIMVVVIVAVIDAACGGLARRQGLLVIPRGGGGGR